MRRTSLGLLLFFLGAENLVEARTIVQTDTDQNGFKLYNIPAPAGLGTAALRLEDVAVGACMLQSSAANGTISCVSAIPYSILTGAPSSLPPSGSASGDLGGTYPSPTVLAGEWNGTRLTFGAIADGALAKRSGTTVVGATAAVDYQQPMSAADPSLVFPTANTIRGNYSAADTTVVFPTVNTVRGNYVAGDGITLSTNSIAQTSPPASWAVANTRWYCVSSSGSDSNVGYSDTSSADCGTKAKQTLAGVGAIFPKLGNNRKVVVEVEAGTYSGGLEQVLASVSGYAVNFPLVVGTGTNSTAGATAFAGDAADRLNAGGVTATGMNAGGYNPIGTLSASLVQAQKVGGASPSFAAEPAIPLFVRMRFGSATATSALRNISRMVMQVTGSDTLTPLSAFPATPSTSDVFYLEQPGVITGASTLSISSQSSQTSAQIVGFSASGTTSLAGSGAVIFSFCDFSTISSRISDTILRPTYVDEGGTTRTLGAGMRISGQFTSVNNRNGNFVQEAFGNTASTTINGAINFLWANGTSTWNGLLVLNDRGSVADDNDQPTAIIGGRIHASEPSARIRGTVTLHGATAGLYVEESSFTISGLDISSMGANPAIHLRGKNEIYMDSGLSGSTGNTDVGLDLLKSIGSTIFLGGAPTVTGTAGDIRLADGTIATWAQALGGLSDTAGNKFIGTASFPLRVMPAGTVLSGGSVTVPNLVGPGCVNASAGGLLSVVSCLAGGLADPGANGVLVRTSPGVTTARTLATDATISIANPDGVAGAPSFARAAVTGGVTIPGGSNAATVHEFPLDATARVAPSTPASGHGAGYEDSTSKAFAFLNDVGGVTHTVASIAAVAHKVMVSLNDAGTFTLAQLDYSDLTNSPTLAAIAISGSASDLITGTVSCARLPALTGDATTSGCALTIAAHAVTNAKLRQGGQFTVIGNPGLTTADVQDIQAAGNHDVLRVESNTLGFGLLSQLSIISLVADLAARALVTRNLTAGAGMTGGGDLSADRTFDVGANADGSIVVNANDVQVGVINDTQHGPRGGGGLHAVATTSVNGFESAADKTRIGTAWPAADEILGSSGPSTPPDGDSTFFRNTTTHLITAHHLELTGRDGGNRSLNLTFAGDQLINKAGSGDLYVGTAGGQSLNLYTGGVTALIITGGGDVDVPGLAAGGSVRADATTGKLSVVTGAPSANWKWSGAFHSLGGFLPSTQTVVVPADDQVASSTGGLTNASCGGCTTINGVVTAQVATNNPIPLYRVLHDYNGGGAFGAGFTFANCTGSGSGVLEFSLWYTTNASNSANYTQLTSTTAGLSVGNLGDIWSSTTFSSAVPTGAEIFTAVRRTDSNVALSCGELKFTMVADMSQ